MLQVINACAVSTGGGAAVTHYETGCNRSILVQQAKAYFTPHKSIFMPETNKRCYLIAIATGLVEQCPS